MKRPNPEKKLTCEKCIFCDYEPPTCIAFDRNQSLTKREYYFRPDWCPFLPFPKLFLKIHFLQIPAERRSHSEMNGMYIPT